MTRSPNMNSKWSSFSAMTLTSIWLMTRRPTSGNTDHTNSPWCKCSKIPDAISLLCVRLHDGMRDTGVGGGNVQADAKELSDIAVI
jgi:hypothetical protein